MIHSRIHIDIETYSSNDLVKSGVYKYVEAPDFDILLIAFCYDDDTDVRCIDMFNIDTDLMNEFMRALRDNNLTKVAYNANFERTCLSKYFEMELPPEQWSDTMITALEAGLPRSLADVGIALGLPEDKMKDPQGKALIRYFCVPCKATKKNGGRTRNLPEHDMAKWELFIRYNKQDVVTEFEIYNKLIGLRVIKSERQLWSLDQRMNDNGVRLDVPMIEKIVDYDNKRSEELLKEAIKLTGLDNPNSLSQLKEWLKEQGVEMKSVTKDTIAEALTGELPIKVRRVLEIRQALGKTSVAKYQTMLSAVNEDERLRGILQFYGANRSGRWAGKLVQTHNLAKNTLPDLELVRKLAAKGDFESIQTLFGETSFVFSELIRTAFIPSNDCRFVVSDFSAIEARVISWLSGEEWRIEAFRSGKDIYCESASQMYGMKVEKHGVNGHLRQKGKIAELALGYQGGVGAMKQMDKGGSIPEEEMQGIVDTWRRANPKIVKLWKSVEAAAKTAITERRSVKMKNGIIFRYVDYNLLIQLPCKRHLCYWNARVEECSMGYKIVYKGTNQTTKRWGDVETYGGKLVENIVQAIARDCLAEKMKRVSEEGYKIVMHVHDEIIVDVPNSDKDAAARITRIMDEPISWAEGLPLKGDTYETNFYRKD